MPKTGRNVLFANNLILFLCYIRKIIHVTYHLSYNLMFLNGFFIFHLNIRIPNYKVKKKYTQINWSMAVSCNLLCSQITTDVSTEMVASDTNCFTNMDYHKTSAWTNDYIHYKVWGEIIYPSLNFNCWTVEVYEWINNSIPHFIVHVIT